MESGNEGVKRQLGPGSDSRAGIWAVSSAGPGQQSWSISRHQAGSVAWRPVCRGELEPLSQHWGDAVRSVSQEECTSGSGASVQPPGEAEGLYGWCVQA